MVQPACAAINGRWSDDDIAANSAAVMHFELGVISRGDSEARQPRTDRVQLRRPRGPRFGRATEWLCGMWLGLQDCGRESPRLPAAQPVALGSPMRQRLRTLQVRDVHRIAAAYGVENTHG